MLTKIRSVIPASARERWYVVSGALVTFLASWGLLEASTAPAWIGLVTATITLLFAVLYSTSTVRTALYSVLLAVQGVAGLYSILGESQWAAIVALAAVLLGTGTAAAKTQPPIAA
jgi:hypothetical protein